MTCQRFLRLFDTEYVVTRLYHKQTKGKNDKILIKKNSCREKKNFKKYFILFFGVNVNVLKPTSLQAL